jgi:hypothetical protein
MALEVTSKDYNGKTYKSVKIGDLDYATSCTFTLSFDECRQAPSKKFPGKTDYHYAINMLDPALGMLSISFAPQHLHNDLKNYKKGDTLKLTAVEKKIEVDGPNGTKIKKAYKGFKVEKVELALQDAEKQKVIDAVREIQKETGVRPTNEQIKQVLTAYGFTKEEDLQSVLTQL